MPIAAGGISWDAHDMAQPVPILSGARRMLLTTGSWWSWTKLSARPSQREGDDLEELMCGFSRLICLPDGLSSPPSAGSGTVMRPSTLQTCATEAGFAVSNHLPKRVVPLLRIDAVTRETPRKP